MKFDSFKQLIKSILTNSTLMTVVGVIFGGLITGYFTYITQKSILDNQREQFNTQYRIERNKQLRTELSLFVNNLSDVTYVEMSKQQKDLLLGKMMSSSVRIILLEDLQIGQQCFDITTELKEIFDKKKDINNSNLNEIIAKWIVSVKSQMKLIDYSVDDKAINSDLMSALLFSSLSEK